MPALIRFRIRRKAPLPNHARKRAQRCARQYSPVSIKTLRKLMALAIDQASQALDRIVVRGSGLAVRQRTSLPLRAGRDIGHLGVDEFGADRADQRVVRDAVLAARLLVEQIAESRDPVLAVMGGPNAAPNRPFRSGRYDRTARRR